MFSRRRFNRRRCWSWPWLICMVYACELGGFEYFDAVLDYTINFAKRGLVCVQVEAGNSCPSAVTTFLTIEYLKWLQDQHVEVHASILKTPSARTSGHIYQPNRSGYHRAPLEYNRPPRALLPGPTHLIDSIRFRSIPCSNSETKPSEISSTCPHLHTVCRLGLLILFLSI